jgi:hypothetical protein
MIEELAGHPITDYGNSLQIMGVIIGNGEETMGVFLPDEFNHMIMLPRLEWTLEEWQAWLKQSDNPQLAIYSDETRRIVKAIVQKNKRMVEEGIRWRVFKRDNYTCRYCHQSDRPMTVDHYIPQDLGGETTEENLRTSCRPCNKEKGNMTPEQWENRLAGKKGIHVGTP